MHDVTTCYLSLLADCGAVSASRAAQQQPLQLQLHSECSAVIHAPDLALLAVTLARVGRTDNAKFLARLTC